MLMVGGPLWRGAMDRAAWTGPSRRKEAANEAERPEWPGPHPLGRASRASSHKHRVRGHSGRYAGVRAPGRTADSRKVPSRSRELDGSRRLGVDLRSRCGAERHPADSNSDENAAYAPWSSYQNATPVNILCREILVARRLRTLQGVQRSRAPLQSGSAGLARGRRAAAPVPRRRTVAQLFF